MLACRPHDWPGGSADALGGTWKGKVQPHFGVNQGALAGPSAMVLRLVCVCVRAAPRAPCHSVTCMHALRVSCPSLSVPVVVAIEATPSCIDHGVRAIEALGR